VLPVRKEAAAKSEDSECDSVEIHLEMGCRSWANVEIERSCRSRAEVAMRSTRGFQRCSICAYIVEFDLIQIWW
jgi:hypothetical protein